MNKIFSPKSFNWFLIGSLLLAGQMIVNIVFENLFFPFSSYYFYIAILLGITGLVHYNYLLDTILGPVLFFAGFYFFLMFTGIYNNEMYQYNWLFITELLPVFVTFLFYSIWIRFRQLFNLRLFLKFLLVFILITAIYSIIGLNKYPLASRQLAGGLARKGDFATIDFYKTIGIAGYDFYYGLAFAMPVFIMLLKKHWDNVFQRFLILFYIGIIYYAIIKSQMTTALLFASLNIFFAAIGLKNIRKSFWLWIFIIGFILFIPNQFYADTVKLFSGIVPGETLQKRLLDLSIAIEYADRGLAGTGTHIEQRAERIPFLLSQFYQSPIIGGGKSTGHVFWFDRLSLFGIIGIIPWIAVLYVFIRETKTVIDKEYHIYFYLSILSFILIGFMKNNGGTLVYFFSFFMVSAILFLYSSGITLFSNESAIEIKTNINEKQNFTHYRRHRLFR